MFGDFVVIWLRRPKQPLNSCEPAVRALVLVFSGRSLPRRDIGICGKTGYEYLPNPTSVTYELRDKLKEGE